MRLESAPPSIWVSAPPVGSAKMRKHRARCKRWVQEMGGGEIQGGLVSGLRQGDGWSSLTT
jgi:hypothetical protein